MIDWIAPALGSPATFSVVSLLDKAVLSRFGLSSSGLSLFVGGNQLVLATVVLLIVPLESPGRNAILGGLGAGAFQGLGLALMFFMLKREDVSRVIPIFQTSPIFVIMLALVFLDESLSLLQWLAVFLAVAGAVLAATKRSEVSGALRPSPAFAVLFLAAAAVGVSQLLVKVTTDDVSVWNTVTLRGYGMGGTMVLIFGRPATVREVGAFFRRRQTGVLLVASEGLLAVGASIQLIVAIARGPVSLVAALLGTRPLFIFGASLVGSRIAPNMLGEPFDRGEFVLKFVAAAMIVAAVVLIAVG